MIIYYFLTKKIINNLINKKKCDIKITIATNKNKKSEHLQKKCKDNNIVFSFIFQ